MSGSAIPLDDDDPTFDRTLWQLDEQDEGKSPKHVRIAEDVMGALLHYDQVGKPFSS